MTSESKPGRDEARGNATTTSTPPVPDPDLDEEMKYGGDDGALEHEGAETNTPENTGSKVGPGRDPASSSPSRSG